MAVYGYCRVSGAKQVKEGVSLEVQQRQIEGWCMIEGLTLDRIYVEEGVSASIPVTKRPQGFHLIAGVKAGDTIVTSRLDRLFRSALDALQTVEAMQKRKVRVVIIDGLGDITGNGMAKAFLTISAAFAELERDTIRERISTVKADQKVQGRYLGGKVPYGYRVEDGALIENEAEQAIIWLMARWRRTPWDGSPVTPIRTIQSRLAKDHGVELSVSTIHRITDELAKVPIPYPYNDRSLYP